VLSEAKNRGNFQWRRQQVIIHMDQTLTFESPIPLAFNGIPVVSLTRDESNNIAVSVNMLTTSVLPRLRMFENDWVSVGNPTDLEALPYGRKLLRAIPTEMKPRSSSEAWPTRMNSLWHFRP